VKRSANRALGGLGSSSGYLQTADRPGGITSSDCEVNPTFCDYNMVYLKYCDGNSFSGARDGSVTVEETDQDLFFRGSFILDAVIEDLVANEGMSEVEEVRLGEERSDGPRLERSESSRSPTPIKQPSTRRFAPRHPSC